MTSTRLTDRQRHALALVTNGGSPYDGIGFRQYPGRYLTVASLMKRGLLRCRNAEWFLTPKGQKQFEAANPRRTKRVAPGALAGKEGVK